VFQRLGISEVFEALVNVCISSFPSANAISIKGLQRITAAAEGKDLDESEAETVVMNGDEEKRKVRRSECTRI